MHDQYLWLLSAVDTLPCTFAPFFIFHLFSSSRNKQGRRQPIRNHDDWSEISNLMNQKLIEASDFYFNLCLATCSLAITVAQKSIDVTFSFFFFLFWQRKAITGYVVGAAELSGPVLWSAFTPGLAGSTLLVRAAGCTGVPSSVMQVWASFPPHSAALTLQRPGGNKCPLWNMSSPVHNQPLCWSATPPL